MDAWVSLETVRAQQLDHGYGILMDWHRGPIAHQYSLIVGDHQALVWYQMTGDWAALISHDHTAIAHNLFKNAIEAQLWCEAYLAKIPTKP